VSLAVVWLHVAAVVTWIGGVSFQAVSLRTGAGAGHARAWLDGARRARPVTWTAVSVVALTGFYNVTALGPLAQVMDSGAALILAGKFILVIAAVALAGQRDFNHLPRAVALLGAGGDPGPALRAIAWLDRIVLALAAVIIYLGLALSRR
jgi:uncharacterized membrane protein